MRTRQLSEDTARCRCRRWRGHGRWETRHGLTFCRLTTSTCTKSRTARTSSLTSPTACLTGSVSLSSYFLLILSHLTWCCEKFFPPNPSIVNCIIQKPRSGCEYAVAEVIWYFHVSFSDCTHYLMFIVTCLWFSIKCCDWFTDWFCIFGNHFAPFVCKAHQ